MSIAMIQKNKQINQLENREYKYIEELRDKDNEILALKNEIIYL